MKFFKNRTERIWYTLLVLAVLINLISTYLNIAGYFSPKKSEFHLPNQSYVQQFLLDQGYELPKYGVDGKCGIEMNDAWNEYNRDNNNF
jgi:hypothetical protein